MRNRQHQRPERGSASRLRSLYLWRAGGALAGAVTVCACWGFFVLTRIGQALDTAAMDAATHALPDMRGIDRYLLSAVSVPMIVALMVAAGLIALWRRRPALAVRAALIIAAATGTTQLLKHALFTRPYLGIGPAVANSLPSGHVCAAATAAVALTVVVPARVRSLTALAGAGLTALMGLAVVLNTWHRPSDVVAAVGVAAFYALLLAPVESGSDVALGRRLLGVLAFLGLPLTGVLVATAVVLVAWATGGVGAPDAAVWVASGACGRDVASLVAALAGAGATATASLAALCAVDRLRR